ncbi:Glucose-6-phosphate dehydrogenase [Planctomycetales bacterium 10988]|nr:Glucose-6-phosphate dehydrogenase [Planctomycetales bacterium 10988]
MPPTIVIFGASGDLTSRKLIPALFQLERKERLPAGTQIVGVSRTEFSHEEFRNKLTESTKKFAGDRYDEETWQNFVSRIYYHPGDIMKSEDYTSLAKFLEEIETEPGSARLYYLSTAPRFYEPAVAELGKAGMATEEHGERRIVIEKPFGTDLETAKKLNAEVLKVFDEDQVYRIDHYLGKETVLNLLVLRFGNSIFEPIWNRQYVDHVQITVAEEVSVGRRGGYYDTSGVLRDMFQNHLLQLMTIMAMECPSEYSAKPVRDEKVKVLQSVRALTEPEEVRANTVRGQYQGYLDEEGVPNDSQTATFAALKLGIENWRWQGVPFYLRSGKAMSCRTTQIVVQFRQPPLLLFSGMKKPVCDANRLVIQIQPAEGIQLQFNTKVPDAGMRLKMTNFDFRFEREYRGVMPEAYERLLLDALRGDASLFARRDEVELAWSIVDPIMSAWESFDEAPPKYEVGYWGPDQSNEWMRKQGCDWFDVCPVLH